MKLDRRGMVYAVADGFPFYTTDCCGASAKGSAGSGTGVVCRACYVDVDPELGMSPDCPEADALNRRGP